MLEAKKVIRHRQTSSPMVDAQYDTWHYQLCADEHWDTEGVIYVQLGPDVGEKFAGAAQDAENIMLSYDLPLPPTAEEIYDWLTSIDP